MLDDIKQLKTKSYMDGETKCFTITTPDGEQYDCQPSGQKWICCGFKSTLKNIKQAIVNDDITSSGMEIEDEYAEHLAAEVKVEETRDLWEHVGLGALLIVHLGPEKCLAEPQIMESLDANGWLLKGDDLTDTNQPFDMDQVQRAFIRYQPPLGTTDVDADDSELDAGQMGVEEPETVLGVPQDGPQE